MAAFADAWSDEKGNEISRAEAVERLATEFEELLGQIWNCEAEWDLDDRIIGALQDAARRHRCRLPTTGRAFTYTCPECGQRWGRTVWADDATTWLPKES